MKKIFYSFLILVLCTSFVYSQNVPELMYYKFENNTTTTTPNYASAPVGTNPAPIIGNVFPGPGGQFDSCLVGNLPAALGNLSGVNTGWNTSFPANWTMSFWLGAGLADGNPSYICGDPGAGSFRVFFGGIAGANTIGIRGPIANTYMTNIYTGTAMVCHIVWDGTNIIAYKNGVLFATYPRTFTTTTGGTGFRVGSYNTAAVSHIIGKLDEFRFYNRALTPAEITATWNVELPLVTGGTWTPQVSGGTTLLRTVSAVNQNVGWIGGSTGAVLRTTNGGTNWASVTGTPIGTADVYAICGIDANTCLVSTSPGATFVYRTSNGGANWTQVFTEPAGFIDDIKFQNATTGFMYGDPTGGRWSLWKTTNGGVNWDSTGLYLVQAGTEAGWNNAMWRSGTNLWFGTNNTRVYKSTNFGATWTFGPTTGSVNSYSVAFNSNTGFTGQTVALKSTDGGSSYSTVTLPGTGTIYSFNGVLNRFWYLRATRIFWSEDNGATYDTQYVGTATYQAMSLILDGNIIRGWAVGSSGVISMYNEVVTGVSSNQNETPSDYSLSQNYPNPFNPSTKISFALPKASDVKIVVYDILGKVVATLVNDYRTAGTHQVEFNASNLASGVYLYRIEAGDFRDAKRMILVK